MAEPKQSVLCGDVNRAGNRRNIDERRNKPMGKFVTSKVNNGIDSVGRNAPNAEVVVEEE